MDTFKAKSILESGGREFSIARLGALSDRFDIDRLPYCLKVLLENSLRLEDGVAFRSSDIEAIAGWDPGAEPSSEIPFQPARVLMQDFTGVPAVVNLVALRDAMEQLGGDPRLINPLVPVDLVIDHSVQVDAFGSNRAFELNAERDYERNGERYQFLRWGQTAFENFRVVPPATGICHQVNLEYLSKCVWTGERDGEVWAYPDTLVGTDSHTTMVNGLGVLGWGVGGIEAEAAMLGQPISMLLPQVVGVRLDGSLPDGATATDLVLTVTEMLREHGVVGKLVEFFGPGISHLSLADRATIGNMSPEFGSTCAIFPVDAETLRYLEFTGRTTPEIELVDAYTREQGMFHEPDDPPAEYSELLELDLDSVVASIAGPRRPQDRIELSEAKSAFERELSDLAPAPRPGGTAVETQVELATGESVALRDGSVVIAAITSCTNTSNPAVMVAAGLVARNAVERGLSRPHWVKTSLAPGSTVVTEYLEQAGLTPYLDALQFDLVGYGCTTCIGNSGPLPAEISAAINDEGLVACSVLSGNRNFEGRINPDTRANYLASPPLVVAYALAGRMDIDLTSEPVGHDPDGDPVYLSDIWPSADEIARVVGECVRAEMFTRSYADVFTGDDRWRQIEVPDSDRYDWPESTYVTRPPFFDGLEVEPSPVPPVEGARVLAVLGDSVTTDHISPAGTIQSDGPAGIWLQEHGVEPADFNSYGARRGNWEVMVRGTFANVRLRNSLADREGGFTRYLGPPGQTEPGEEMPIYDAAMLYRDQGVPLVVLAGREYGSGSSRDWAAKGTYLLGVRAVIAESYERIHRSNLIGMGVVPLQFPQGSSVESLGLTGQEVFDIGDLADGEAKTVPVVATSPDGAITEFEAVVRIDTPNEVSYFRNGGILQRVLRDLNSDD